MNQNIAAFGGGPRRVTMRYWATFAGRGDLNGHGPPDWPTYRGGGNGTVQFGPDNVSTMPDYAAEHHCAFWRAVGRAGLRMPARRRAGRCPAFPAGRVWAWPQAP
ncbi:hypothetical protein ACFY6U_13095 [Streptomyces sp. NPDC013157]|uniref:hypothetical protein n=1 Tax=Streptomyces sp. NPDC013157 TaxID=3364861 RepID=UPI0036B9ABE8